MLCQRIGALKGVFISPRFLRPLQRSSLLMRLPDLSLSINFLLETTSEVSVTRCTASIMHQTRLAECSQLELKVLKVKLSLEMGIQWISAKLVLFLCQGFHLIIRETNPTITLNSSNVGEISEIKGFTIKFTWHSYLMPWHYY